MNAYKLSRCLYRDGRSVELVQEQQPATVWGICFLVEGDYIPFDRERLHGHVAGFVALDVGEAHQIGWIALAQPQVNDLQVVFLGDLVNDGGLAHAWATTEHRYQAGTDELGQHGDRLGDFYLDHFGSLFGINLL